MAILTHVVSIILSALVTYIFTERHFRRKKWHEFDQRRLDEFYGPVFGLIRQGMANAERNIQVSNASNQAWREICERNPRPFEDHDKYFEPFKKSLDWENERFRKEDIPAFDKMLEVFKIEIHLAYPSTKALFNQFSQYVDQWHRPLPYEVLNRLDLSAEPLARLYADIEAHFDRLRRKLSGEKRVE
ncbi:MAG: hypothetical protein FJ012_11040 [Chloroflexi bacterium]|nr:hypothetical protein [Chloroflexota bacterium]